ncbi:hypothetical protein Lste_2170 [Legionella steelei]|uniref:Uncharacterized protein n=1 Tax=Legionella steelei TaxID=947033 RepID=A0A0W0ZJ69_9GAMM|nr:hypothetical protein Lste_2170 [Legionella steelei]
MSLGRKLQNLTKCSNHFMVELIYKKIIIYTLNWVSKSHFGHKRVKYQVLCEVLFIITY